MAAGKIEEKSDQENGAKPSTEIAVAEKASIPPELKSKHPLHNKWTLWFFQFDKNQAWEDNLQEVSSFEYVEDFWALFNHIEPASRLPTGCDYSMFKYGVKPMWEDDSNKHGGRWLINFQRNHREALDECWLEVLLCLIGEQFGDDGETVNGAVVAVRNKGDKIGLWTSDWKHSNEIMSIGSKLKEKLGMDRALIGYQSHADTIDKRSSKAKDMYTV